MDDGATFTITLQTATLTVAYLYCFLTTLIYVWNFALPFLCLWVYFVVDLFKFLFSIPLVESSEMSCSSSSGSVKTLGGPTTLSDIVFKKDPELVTRWFEALKAKLSVGDWKSITMAIPPMPKELVEEYAAMLNDPIYVGPRMRINVVPKTPKPCTCIGTGTYGICVCRPEVLFCEVTLTAQLTAPASRGDGDHYYRSPGQ